MNNRNRLWFAYVLWFFFVFFNAFAQGTYYPDEIGNTWRFQSINKVNKKTIKIVEPDTNFGISGVKVLIDETNDRMLCMQVAYTTVLASLLVGHTPHRIPTAISKQTAQ